jgi:AraC-like DNA-binding protein
MTYPAVPFVEGNGRIPQSYDNALAGLQPNQLEFGPQQPAKGGKKPISSRAIQTGFADQSHSKKVFRRVTGVPPRAWTRDQNS